MQAYTCAIRLIILFFDKSPMVSVLLNIRIINLCLSTNNYFVGQTLVSKTQILIIFYNNHPQPVA